jgi:hypothetical protein
MVKSERFPSKKRARPYPAGPLEMILVVLCRTKLGDEVFDLRPQQFGLRSELTGGAQCILRHPLHLDQHQKPEKHSVLLPSRIYSAMDAGAIDSED